MHSAGFRWPWFKLGSYVVPLSFPFGVYILLVRAQPGSLCSPGELLVNPGNVLITREFAGKCWIMPGMSSFYFES